MKINLKTKIKYNGQEYSSVEELPPEARSAYEKAIAAESAIRSTEIVFNGREYASPEQMPTAERQLYEDAMKLAHDTGGIGKEEKVVRDSSAALGMTKAGCPNE